MSIETLANKDLGLRRQTKTNCSDENRSRSTSYTFELLTISSTRFDWLFVNVYAATVCFNFDKQTAVSVEPRELFLRTLHGKLCMAVGTGPADPAAAGPII